MARKLFQFIRLDFCDQGQLIFFLTVFQYKATNTEICQKSEYILNTAYKIVLLYFKNALNTNRM